MAGYLGPSCDEAGHLITRMPKLNVIADALDQLHPGRTTNILVTNGALIAEPRNARGMRPSIALVLGAMLLLLLMVCTNVTTLLLARAAARRHEMAVRVSLAQLVRLLRQLLTESLVLALQCGTVSLGFAYVRPRPIAQHARSRHRRNRIICPGLASARLHMGTRGAGGVHGRVDARFRIASDPTRGRRQPIIARWRVRP